ncbi:MAG: helicase HerA-like domain-containing protein, partial [Dehalococcoidia bacterium]
MTDGIEMGDGLVFPPDAITQTFAILAKRGVGKSTTARKFAEGLAAVGAQFVYVDPVGVTWGLRSSADGSAAGLNLYIFGGEHGDLPLSEQAGALMADVVLESGASVIFDLSDMGEAAMRRFLTDFCVRLYHRKARDRRPLHLILDEADEFCPQRIPPAGAALFGAIDRIVRRGRARGLGVTLISQRPAVVNKDVLTQCEVLIAMRVVHPRDRKALEEWATEKDGMERTKEFAASLTSLDIGEAWVWSPGWLDVFKRVRITMPWTYDSSYTPKPGESRPDPAGVLDVDLDALGARIAATREQAKATDPKALQARVRELEAEIAAIGKHDPAQSAEFEAERRRLIGRSEALLETIQRYEGVIAEARRRLAEAEAEVGGVWGLMDSALSGTVGAVDSPPPVAPSAPVVRPAAAPSADGALSAYQRDLLTAVAQRHPAPSTRAQVATLARKSIKSSAFGPNLRALMDAGYVM